MAPPKNMKGTTTDATEGELQHDKVLQLKTGTMATPKKSDLAKTAAVTSAKKAVKTPMKTPKAVTGTPGTMTFKVNSWAVL